MDPHVSQQSKLSDETLPTGLAGERLLSGVDFAMSPHGVLKPELFLTEVTFDRCSTCVWFRQTVCFQLLRPAHPRLQSLGFGRSLRQEWVVARFGFIILDCHHQCFRLLLQDELLSFLTDTQFFMFLFDLWRLQWFLLLLLPFNLGEL